MKFGNLVEICLWPHLAVKGLSTKETSRRMLTRTSTFGTLQNYYLLSFTEEIMHLC